MKKTFTKLFVTVAFLLVTSTMWAQNITFMVDMTNYIAGGGVISANGVHMTGNFTAPTWTPEEAYTLFTQVGATNVYSFTLNTADPNQFVQPPTDPDYKFKFINSQQANFSWGACHVDQECLPSGAACTDGGDNRSLGLIGSLPASDSYYSAMWDSCAGVVFTLTGINEIKGAVTALSAYPNPAVDNTTVSFVLVQSAKNITIALHNALGQVVNQVSETNQAPGIHNYDISTSNLANGVYFYSVNVDGAVAADKLVVSK